MDSQTITSSLPCTPESPVPPMLPLHSPPSPSRPQPSPLTASSRPSSSSLCSPCAWPPPSSLPQWLLLHRCRLHLCLLTCQRFLRTCLRLLLILTHHCLRPHHLHAAPVTVLFNLQHVTLCSVTRLHCLSFHLLFSPSLLTLKMKI